jgi:hypothetical protein
MANELLEELQRMNAESKAWMEEKEGRISFMLTEDLDHWAGYGITTVEEFHAYLDACYENERRKDAMYFDEEEYYAEIDRQIEEATESHLANCGYQAPTLADVWV